MVPFFSCSMSVWMYFHVINGLIKKRERTDRESGRGTDQFRLINIINIADTDQPFRYLLKVNLQLQFSDMKKDMGNTDRVIRIVLALVVAVLYFTNVISGTLAYVLLAIAGIFVLTSFFGSCLLYRLFGIDTRTAKKI